jgi:Na+-translocating ferredoxin:NAD+ oxidoreductase RnfG subunit
MDNLKIILRQTVDVIFGLTALTLLIIYMVDISKNGIGEEVNYTGFLLLVVGYTFNNIVNKVRLIKKKENG